MISQELEVSLHMAFVEARRLHHEFLTVEHLLLALLDNPSASKVLSACSVNIDDLRKTLTSFIKDNTPQVSGTKEVDTQPTLGFQRVIKQAIMHNGKKEVTGDDVLLAIFNEKNSHAVYYLHQHGITCLDVVNLNTSSIKNMKAVLQFTALALSLTLLVVSLWAYTFPKTGNFPSLIVLGAVGWFAFSISLSTCKSSQNS